MKSSIENNIFVTLTLYILIITGIKIFIPNNNIFIVDEFQITAGKWYGIAIISLVLSYVYYQLGWKELSKIKEKINKMLLANLIFTSILLLGIIFAEELGSVISSNIIVFSILVNIFIPFFTIIYPLIINWINKKLKEKLPK
ncbi:MAG: hypothetical protein ACOCQQ_00800 [Candidatus Nanoarchaeia archaeon]